MHLLHKYIHVCLELHENKPVLIMVASIETKDLGNSSKCNCARPTYLILTS